MARRKFKWKFAFIFYLVTLGVLTKSLPLSPKNNDLPLIADTLVENDDTYVSAEASLTNNENITDVLLNDTPTTTEDSETEIPAGSVVNVIDVVPENVEVDPEPTEEEGASFNVSSLLRNEPVRPGQTVGAYTIDITINGGTFSGRAIINVQLTAATLEDNIRLHCEGLNVESVVYGIVTLTNPQPANFFVDDGVLEIEPPQNAAQYVFLVTYTGNLRNDGFGLYQVNYDDTSYLAMNLHPMYARRVFPCMDEPTLESTISFTFNNIQYTQIVSNSIIDNQEGSSYQFTALQGPPHRWGMIAHNLVNIVNPIAGTRLFVRSGYAGFESQGSTIINAVYGRLEEWTSRSLLEIHLNQNEVIDILAVQDITMDWHALSTVPIWEPYILMPSTAHSVMQRKTAIVKISESLANQWFGYVVFPENWRYQWIVDGFSSHAAYEAARSFQETIVGTDNYLDMNTIFVADVIQEALLYDGYSMALPLDPGTDLFNEDQVREHMSGLIKLKAPAIMWLLKSVLGPTDNPDIDYLQTAARALLFSRSLQTFNTLNFYDSINSEWMGATNRLIDDLPEFLEPWVLNNNYPVINVQSRAAGVIITQERFSFTTVDQISYQIPISYTTSVNPNFDNVAPTALLDNNLIIDLFLDEEDWFLANIQGQGYYRVNYDAILWERIILALEDGELRNQIHPLNRATLIDDALNLARAGKLDYDIAFRVVLTMWQEVEYAPWKAFIRNMEFLRKRFFALVAFDDDEEFDPDIYLRMVRRTIVTFENEVGFYPDPLIVEDAMTSLTRGIVMEHACKTKYQPCVAAGIDWFYDPNSNEPVVNPNIPHDIRPAVYCTMMREGDEGARNALWAQYYAETSLHERLVIARAFGCSSDENYLTSLLTDTVIGVDPFSVEERSQFFISMVESSFQNADLALRFMRLNAPAIRDRYGGPEKLEQLIHVLAENCADIGMTETFEIWVNSINSGLQDSEGTALRALNIAMENLVWDQVHMDLVYEWIDENDAHTIAVSVALLMFGYMATLLFR